MAGAVALGSLVPGSVVLGSVAPEVGEVEEDLEAEALGAPEDESSVPAPPSSGWHAVITRAAEAAAMVINTLLRMPFLYCMISPDADRRGSRPSPPPVPNETQPPHSRFTRLATCDTPVTGSGRNHRVRPAFRTMRQPSPLSLAMWAARLGRDQQRGVQPDGTTTGPYAAWQVVGLVLTLLAPVYWAASRRCTAGAVITSAKRD